MSPLHAENMKGSKVAHANMPRKIHENVTHASWDAAQEWFEFGRMTVTGIAEKLGVSRHAVMRQMAKRGAIRNSRVPETVAALEAELDRKVKRRAEIEEDGRAKAWAQANATMDALGCMIQSLLHADRLGDLTLASGVIACAYALSNPRSRKRTRKNVK